MNNKDKLVGKIILKGKIINTSPLIIGQGKGDLIDIEIIKDKNGVPYIPASSFAGALRHYIKNNYKVLDGNSFEYFWGSNIIDENKETYQSHFILNDLTPINEDLVKRKINIRNGIKINNKIGITEEKAKYNYEILEPQVEFSFQGELTLRQEFNEKKEELYKILQTIINILKNEKLKVGAITTRGFGEIKLNNIEIYEFDFSNEEDAINYLTGIYTNPKTKISENTLEKKNKNTFYLTAELKIKNSLIIGSYSPNPEAPDKTHIESDGKPVLAGTSVKGAIRNKAVKIVNTLGGNGEEYVKDLMGYTDENTKEKIKSRMYVKETTVEEYLKKLQNRIRIDRFTGGVIHSALFDSFALWAKENNKVFVKIKIEEAKDEDIGLLLLLLKDLWTGHLTIGGEKNIGRGTFEGIFAKIVYEKGEEKIKAILENKNGKLDIKGNKENIKQELENFVSEFIKSVRGRR
ncbi:RAMP superfamily CRISPR-associated protein [Persephonella sp. KM09-Lau-8]|uniref:RAMP superfamily CRISPR-associated protein n=1 Tax=Persephonella sp. KM09-Lau-8 TaxID=1158345 RepID=UPI0004972880|nr:RAMP superfamily CRISPR-associated protein [Persephonella sp. KM09-Lau-8]